MLTSSFHVKQIDSTLNLTILSKKIFYNQLIIREYSILPSFITVLIINSYRVKKFSSP